MGAQDLAFVDRRPNADGNRVSRQVPRGEEDPRDSEKDCDREAGVAQEQVLGLSCRVAVDDSGWIAACHTQYPWVLSGLQGVVAF